MMFSRPSAIASTRAQADLQRCSAYATQVNLEGCSTRSAHGQEVPHMQWRFGSLAAMQKPEAAENHEPPHQRSDLGDQIREQVSNPTSDVVEKLRSSLLQEPYTTQNIPQSSRTYHNTLTN